MVAMPGDALLLAFPLTSSVATAGSVTSAIGRPGSQA